jgi:hypothetical protein
MWGKYGKEDLFAEMNIFSERTIEIFVEIVVKINRFMQTDVVYQLENMRKK